MQSMTEWMDSELTYQSCLLLWTFNSQSRTHLTQFMFLSYFCTRSEVSEFWRIPLKRIEKTRYSNICRSYQYNKKKKEKKESWIHFTHHPSVLLKIFWTKGGRIIERRKLCREMKTRVSSLEVFLLQFRLARKKYPIKWNEGREELIRSVDNISWFVVQF